MTSLIIIITLKKSVTVPKRGTSFQENFLPKTNLEDEDEEEDEDVCFSSSPSICVLNQFFLTELFCALKSGVSE